MARRRLRRDPTAAVGALPAAVPGRVGPARAGTRDVRVERGTLSASSLWSRLTVSAEPSSTACRPHHRRDMGGRLAGDQARPTGEHPRSRPGGPLVPAAGDRASSRRRGDAAAGACRRRRHARGGAVTVDSAQLRRDLRLAVHRCGRRRAHRAFTGAAEAPAYRPRGRSDAAAHHAGSTAARHGGRPGRAARAARGRDRRPRPRRPPPISWRRRR